MPEYWRRRELRWKENKDYDGGLPGRRSSHFNPHLWVHFRFYKSKFNKTQTFLKTFANNPALYYNHKVKQTGKEE